jgi:hypothetical protein
LRKKELRTRAGAMIWSVLDCRHGWKLYLQFLVYGYGVLGSRISTALLALSLLLQARGQCHVNKYRSDHRQGK